MDHSTLDYIHSLDSWDAFSEIRSDIFVRLHRIFHGSFIIVLIKPTASVSATWSPFDFGRYINH